MSAIDDRIKRDRARLKMIRQLNAEGYSNSDIATKLKISEHIVRGVLQADGNLTKYRISITVEKDFQPSSKEISNALMSLVREKVDTVSRKAPRNFEVDVIPDHSRERIHKVFDTEGE